VNASDGGSTKLPGAIIVSLARCRKPASAITKAERGKNPMVVRLISVTMPDDPVVYRATGGDMDIHYANQLKWEALRWQRL
jgi:hypothetical protein